MILKEITIENFKGIEGPLNLKLKPITLLFGPNSAGKSSIIQALNYARHIFITEGDLNPDSRTLDGRTSNLGQFKDIVHNHDLEKPIVFDFLLDYTEVERGFIHFFSDSIYPYLTHSKSEKKLDKELADIGLDPDTHAYCASNLSKFGDFYISEIEYIGNKIKTMNVKVSILWNAKRMCADISKIEGLANEYPLFSIIRDEADLNVVELSFYNHEIIPECVKEAIYTSCEYDIIEIDHLSKLPEYDWDRNDALNQIQQLKNKQKNIKKNHDPEMILFKSKLEQKRSLPVFDDTINFSYPYRSKRYCSTQFWTYAEEISKDDEKFFINLISLLVTTPLRSLSKVFQKIEYLGPIREIPSRNYTPARHPESFFWTSGLAAYDLMLHPSTEEKLVEEINQWLSGENHLNSGYAVKLKKFSVIDEQKKLLKKVDRLDNLDEIKTLLKEALSQEKRVEFSIIDTKLNVELLPQDLGTGISQIFPIIVAALWMKNRILMVEQPELHVHPAMQAAMGDLFIHCANPEKTNHNLFILETHSEHLMLRILRRIREASEVENESEFNFSSDNVSVNFLQRGEQGTKNTKIAVNEDGEFASLWPNGFFEERIEELF